MSIILILSSQQREDESCKALLFACDIFLQIYSAIERLKDILCCCRTQSPTLMRGIIVGRVREREKMNNNVVTNRERVFEAPACDIACFSLARDTFGVLAQLQYELFTNEITEAV